MIDPASEVIVLGAGAAGLMAGLRAAEGGARTLVLEKNGQPGVKILMSGGTRCNLTHATDNRVRIGNQEKLLHAVIKADALHSVVMRGNEIQRHMILIGKVDRLRYPAVAGGRRSAHAKRR